MPLRFGAAPEMNAAEREFWVAWSLLSRIPGRLVEDPTPGDLERSVRWYALVGLVQGVVLWVMACALGALNVPGHLMGPLLLAMHVWQTGGLHLDGFLDTCDGLALVRHDRDRALEVMRDPRAGAVGVVFTVCLLLVKAGALGTIGAHPGLVLVPLVARAALPGIMGRYAYVRVRGIAVHQAAACRTGVGASGAMLGIAAPLFVLSWPFALLFVLVVWLMGRWVAARMNALFSGLTGDIYGTVVETIELAALLMLVVGVLM